LKLLETQFEEEKIKQAEKVEKIRIIETEVNKTQHDNQNFKFPSTKYGFWKNWRASRENIWKTSWNLPKTPIMWKLKEKEIQNSLESDLKDELTVLKMEFEEKKEEIPEKSQKNCWISKKQWKLQLKLEQ